jgi:hypothetical protein
VVISLAARLASRRAFREAFSIIPESVGQTGLLYNVKVSDRFTRYENPFLT